MKNWRSHRSEKRPLANIIQPALQCAPVLECTLSTFVTLRSVLDAIRVNIENRSHDITTACTRQMQHRYRRLLPPDKEGWDLHDSWPVTGTESPSQSQVRVGSRGVRDSQDGVSQQQETVPLYLPQLNRLNETFLMWEEDTSNVVLFPDQNRIIHQIITRGPQTTPKQTTPRLLVTNISLRP
jgi:hypothetical protein